jgi:hypothetical protein
VKNSNNGKANKEVEKEVQTTSINVDDVDIQNSNSTIINEAVLKNCASIDSNDNDYNADNTQPLLPEGSYTNTRISRAFGFATLGAGLALGSVSELARRTLFGRQSNNNSSSSSSSSDSLILSNIANALRLTNS